MENTQKTQFQFKKKEYPKLPIEVDGEYIELEINTSTGNIMESYSIAEKIQLNKNNNKDRVLFLTEFIKISKLIFGVSAYNDHLQFLDLDDFAELMIHTINNYINPEAEKINKKQNVNFNEANYKKPFEVK